MATWPRPIRRAAMAAVAVALLGAIGFLWSNSTAVDGQGVRGEPYKAARAADGHPNLNGVWQTFNSAHYDVEPHAARPAMAVIPARPVSGAPGLGRATPVELPVPALMPIGAVGGVPAGDGVVEGDRIPYRPEALAIKKENAEHWLERDPEIKCFMPGVPRATYMPYPFQIVQGTDKVLIAHEFAGTTRTIHMTPVAKSPATTWMGWSLGRWDGESLVIESTDFNDQTWFDRAGNYHSDQLKTTERFTMVSPDHLMYEVTIDDPKVFTRPWKMSMPVYRRLEKNARILEYKCVEFVEQMMYGHLGVMNPATGQANP